MGKAKSKGPKFAVMKKMITKKTVNKYKQDVLNPNKKDAEKEKLGRNVPQVSSALFFSYNTALGPPYRVIVDTNFINFSIQNKLDLEKGMMDCLYAKCTPCITDCVMAELEKLGQKYRVALRIAKDPRFQRLACTHKGTYADDCIVERVTQHKCYIVATCDRDLKRRIRKVPGVPIMYITRHRYSIERLPEATVGGGLDLLCHHRYHWKSNEISMAHLQEVELTGLTGTDCEVWFMKTVLASAKGLFKVAISFNPYCWQHQGKMDAFERMLLDEGMWTSHRDTHMLTCLR
ncbi:hypothetical protein C2845_PM09G03490 [Panicum miliaceum]|uniref:PIN domain-containing protein n=1 Tax=Panicum miliaceum TaxID=4540 RepID=A0A3L6S2C5_PANMI|nr:hypothetical protein C2845_PM09G03490 [Panicum miliaceum]